MQKVMVARDSNVAAGFAPVHRPGDSGEGGVCEQPERGGSDGAKV